ncbi:MAG: hypothetical protein A2751_02320 [Candidatus Doudnabacteria bacterium RIFCSPHIGHO2_01_FULL_46_14]|uniref:Uncharacterized protein n=1 Tax=Candidatus Doudnabacteria bacterium RIFCSPHIGHO2_01_FULL_46_14 TaxID=1817824 RepID=A0A1F5NJI5_9BACT|nr:MAG: hypothetical protein A2751_02320 [Candidatus Doudnabacteria bacterium RIFCSPHIGHO2_01_FULL_46_14]
MLKTLMAYLFGCVIGLTLSAEAVSRSSLLLSAFTITALVASFKHPFAGLSRGEWWQKFVLQYAPAALFGIFTPAVWHEAGIDGLSVLLCSGSIHLASWKNSSDSRRYRLEQFQLGFADFWPDHARMIAILNAEGKSEIADELIESVISGDKAAMIRTCGNALKHLSEAQKGLIRSENVLRER